ncbi:MAG: hypothetical protein ACFB0B_16930 [Thermonemataceae bacterium]
MIKYLSYLIIFISSTLGCQKANRSATLPEGFSVVVNQTDGMLPRYKKLQLSPEECYEEVSTYDVKRSVSFTLSSEQFLAIYRLFEENNFKEIKMRQEDVSDRGGATIDLRYNGKRVTKADAGQLFIEGQDKIAFDNILEGIWAIVTPPLQAQKIPITLTLDASLRKTDFVVSLQLNQDLNYQSTKGIQSSFGLYLAEGTQVIVINVYTQANAALSKSTIASEKLMVKVDDTNQEIVLQLKEGKIIPQVK